MKRVLLIEDSETQARRMILFIEAMRGWQVQHVDSLAAAKRAVESGAAYDLVVVDLTLPDAHGLEAVTFAREALPDSVCVVVTGEEQLTTAASALEHGASDYLVKIGLTQDTVNRALHLATLRRSLIQQAKDAERNLGEVLSAMQDALFVVDGEGRVCFLNAKAKRLRVRFRDDEPEGVLLHATPQMYEQTMVQDAQGAMVPVEVKTSELQWGRAPARLVMLRDLSTQRQMETLQADLKRVEELAEVGEEAFGDWHDLKNRVQGMEGLVGEIEDELQGAAANHVYALRGLLDEVAATARKYHRGAVKRRNVREPLDLSALVEARCAMFRAACAEEAIVRLRVARVPPALGDQLELGGAIDNLLSNALKALRRQQRRGLGTIEVTTWSAGTRVCVRVTDDGPGFPSDDLERWTRPHETGDTSGTGLGLARVRDTMRRHGGDVLLQSTQAGASLTLWLPLAKMTAQGNATGKRRVLLVEDDYNAAMAARRHLARHYDVAWAEDGQAALELLEEDQAFDAVLCDLEMPRMNGVGFYMVVRRRWPELAARVAFCSGGMLDRGALPQLWEADVPMLPKPFRAEAAVALIEQIAEAPPG